MLGAARLTLAIREYFLFPLTTMGVVYVHLGTNGAEATAISRCTSDVHTARTSFLVAGADMTVDVKNLNQVSKTQSKF